jgi:catechol 2,3-dioxygenase-like lactoylglutathione lyase family enzyme
MSARPIVGNQLDRLRPARFEQPLSEKNTQENLGATSNGPYRNGNFRLYRPFRYLFVVRRQGDIVTVKRMDNVGIVVEDIDAAIEFFTELGLSLEGRMPIEGEWAGRVTGLRGQRVEIAMMRTPDGHSRLELSRFDAPAIVSDHRTAPVNSLGYLRVMFAVDDIDDTLARLSKLGATVVDEVVNYEDIYRLCYIRGPEGILIGLAQQLEQQASRENPMERNR